MGRGDPYSAPFVKAPDASSERGDNHRKDVSAAGLDGT